MKERCDRKWPQRSFRCFLEEFGGGNTLEYAVEEKLILVNPAKKCKIPKNTRKEMNILPEALIGPYLSAAKEHGILAPMYLELTTGLRRGELLALRWEDLDVQNHTLSINKSVARQDGKLVISTPKTPNSIRTVLLPEETVKLLVEEHERHPVNPYLFPSPRTGETRDPDGFRRLHDRIIKEIGAEHVRFHDMRHTFATLSLKSGVDVRTLSETLGHFSAGFTLSTYVHSTRGRCDRKHHPQRDLTPKPKRRLQLAAAVKIFGKRLENGIFVLFCQINLDKSTAFSRPFGSNLGQVA